MTKDQLLQGQIQAIAAWVSCFDGLVATPRIGLGPNKQTLYIKNFPLPDGYNPNCLDIVLDVSNFPVDPPKGIYLLTNATSRPLVDHLKRSFNIFQNSAAHSARPVQGYEWICVGYINGWRFNPNNPPKGDNILKMLQSWWRILDEGK